jgi:hypothetical protein
MSKVSNTTFLSVMALGVLILTTEPFIVNYEPGHFGWVSLHSMAQAKNARPENFLVGYTCEFEDGFKEYFQRYSVLFTVFTKYLLRPFESDSALHLYLSRQLMNTIYVAIMGVMLFIARRILNTDARALLAVLLSAAGFITLRYKNMYDFHQLGLLAFLIFLGILVKFDLSEINRRRGRFLASVALLSMIGQSHLIAFACLVWVILEALMGVFAGNRKRADWRRNMVLSALALLVSSSTVAVNIVYNASIEARLNNVGLLETDIVDSAETRLGLDKQRFFSTMKFAKFARRQIEFVSINSVPGLLGAFVVDHQDLRPLVAGLSVLAGVCLAICVVSFLNHVLRRMFSRGYDQCNRERILLMMSVTGPLYLLVMRHWSSPHHFAAVYYLGSYLAFWIFVMSVLKMRKAVWQSLLVLVALLFVISVANIREFNATITNPINYGELDAYAQFLAGGNDPSVYIEGGYEDFVEGSPYAMCYFLSPSKISRSSQSADWVLTKEGEHYALLPVD